MGREFFTDSDNFGVTFPIDLDVKVSIKHYYFLIEHTENSIIDESNSTWSNISDRLYVF